MFMSFSFYNDKPTYYVLILNDVDYSVNTVRLHCLCLFQLLKYIEIFKHRANEQHRHTERMICILLHRNSTITDHVIVGGLETT